MSKPIPAPTYALGPDFHARLDALAGDLLPQGLTALQEDFCQIPAFVAAAREEDPGRDAHTLRQTPPEVYLLEALTFQVLDQHHTSAFSAAERVLVVLPDCLSMHNPDCLRDEDDLGDRCVHCTPDCPASRATALAERHGARAIFSRRDLEGLLRAWQAREPGSLAVVGVACVLMLANGMRTATALGIPARGVLLEGCSCEHWNDQPFGSSFDLERLDHILTEWR